MNGDRFKFKNRHEKKWIRFICPIFTFCLLFYIAPTAAQNNKTPDTGDNNRNALDWDGIYRGVLPCADCEGIQETIYLNRNLTFLLKTKYMGKSDSVYIFTGSFSWNDPVNTIKLKGSDLHTEYFLVGENILTQLDK